MTDLPDGYVHKFNGGNGVSEGLHWLAECTDCDWSNKRGLRDSAVRSKNGHERYHDHAVRVVELDTPECVSDEAESKEDLARQMKEDGKSLKDIAEHEDIDDSVSWVREATNGGFDS